MSRTVVLVLAALLGMQAAVVAGNPAPSPAKDAGTDTLALQRARTAALDAKSGKVAVTVPAGEIRFFTIDLASHVDTMGVSVTGSGGDVDLFVKQGVPHVGNTVQALAGESAAFSAGDTSTESVTMRRNGGPLTPGRWWIALVNVGNSTAQVDLDAEVTTAGAPFAASIGQTGTWFEPAKNYQGMFIQYLSPANAVVVWFTFTTEGDQAWLLGLGTVQGDSIFVERMDQSRGGRFGEAFRSEDVVLEDVGNLLITFDTCTTGYASFESARADWPHEQLRIEQITGVAGLDCNGSSKASYVGSGMSGSWYNPQRPGEGWLVQVFTDDLAVGYWFTYDADGNQAWFGGLGAMVDGSIVIADVVQPVGGRFGANYSPSQVTLQPWGAMAMTFSGCNTAAMAGYGPAGYGTYTDPGWERLTGIAGTQACDLRTDPLDLTAQLQVVPFSFPDGDTNDPASANIDNDTPSQVQSVGNPQIVAGFLAATPTGRAGDRFGTSTDAVDAFRMTITAGQSIQLVVSDWTAADPFSTDFDVYLYAAGDVSTPVQTALGTDRNEFITVQQTGTYNIVVQAFAGSGNYVLVVSNAPAPAAASSLKLEADVVPGEILVRFEEPWDNGEAPVALYKSVLQREDSLGLELASGQPGRAQLFRLPEDTSAAVARLGGKRSPHAAMAALGWHIAAERTPLLDGILAIKALRARGEVRHAEPNVRVYPLAVPSDPRYREQWHYPMINLSQAFDVTSGSPDVVVAVLDTGVNPHPDLAANIRIATGVDLVSSLSGAADGDAADRNAQDPGSGPNAQSDSFHGTHVAGTVAAISGNGIGGVGVAPRVGIMPVRVLGRSQDGGRGSGSDILAGIEWASGLQVGGQSAGQAADVINMSLGGPAPCDGIFVEAVAQARAAGVIVIAAAGNSNSGVTTFPADCPGVVKVSAVGRDYLPANYSNCNAVDAAAPGGEVDDDNRWHSAGLTIAPACKGSLGGRHMTFDGVLSTLSQRNNAAAQRYGFYNGTSMAAPHAAGVAALMRSVHPALSPAEFDAMLANGELTFDPRDIGIAVPSTISSQYARHYGNGIIDALAAVRAARERAGNAGGAPPAALLFQPSALDFGELAQSLTLDISRVGSGGIAVQSLTVDVPWLSGSGGGPDGLGRYTLTIDRDGLPEATYTGTLSVQPTSGATLAIPVSMRVGSTPEVGRAGRVYALLIDAVTFEVLRQDDIDASSGFGTLSYADVLPGRYFLVYGTDSDNDFVICDRGEFCGFVPFGDVLEPFELRGTDLEIGFAPLAPDLDGVGSAGAGAGTSKSAVLGHARRMH